MPSIPAASTIPAQAFRFLELDPISSFADGAPEAAAAAEVYPESLRMVLEVAEWSFATRLAQLAEADLLDDDVADDDLPHVFVLPDDCVAVREVLGLDVAWRLDQTYLRCDTGGPLKIRYTALIQNEARMPATVRTAVALQMAVLLAPRYMQTRTKRADLVEQLREAMGMALRQDARNASPQAVHDDAWAGRWDLEATR
jgi:hypothetical protein